jgi:hypothetical protein
MADNNKNSSPKLEKNWDKEAYLLSKLDSRERSFYIDTGSFFFKISMVLAATSMVLALYCTYKVHKLPQITSYYLNSIDGKIYDNNLSPEKIEKLRTAIKKYKENKAIAEASAIAAAKAKKAE